MKFLLAAILALVPFSSLISEEKIVKDKEVVTMPLAKIIGPTTAATGRMVMLKTTGSLGDDPQITCTPVNTNWFVVRFQDDKNLGVVFDTDKPGNYIFALGVNKSGRTAIAVHVVTVGAPGPEVTTLDLKAAYTKDLAAGVGVKGNAKLLAQCYTQSISSLFPGYKTNKGLQDGMHELIDTTIGEGKLPNTRAMIAQYVGTKLGTDPSARFDATAATTAWNDIAAACLKLD